MVPARSSPYGGHSGGVTRGEQVQLHSKWLVSGVAFLFERNPACVIDEGQFQTTTASNPKTRKLDACHYCYLVIIAWHYCCLALLLPGTTVTWHHCYLALLLPGTTVTWHYCYLAPLFAFGEFCESRAISLWRVFVRAEPAAFGEFL